LAALASTDDFDTARGDDPDMKQMIDTVLQLEASLQDCTVLGPQKVVDAFIACQLTPGVLNRWNSPVLDGLWQAVTGRTPDGVTPFAVNPPETVAELLDRLVWPKAYPEAVELMLELMNPEAGNSLAVAPAIVTCTRAGHVEVAQRLLSCNLDDVARRYLLDRLPTIAACGHLPCCEIIFPYLIPYGSCANDYDDPLSASLKRCAKVNNLAMVKFLLSHYTFSSQMVEHAAACSVSNQTLAVVDLLFNSIPNPSDGFFSRMFSNAAGSNCIQWVQRAMARGVDAGQCRFALDCALRSSCDSELLVALLTGLPGEHRAGWILGYIDWFAEYDVFPPWGDSLRDLPRSTVQNVLDTGLAHAVSKMQSDQIRLYLQHGAHARASDDYIIYLAAVSGRADVMELLLGAADVDAECAVRYRQQMSEPAGLLGVAQQLRRRIGFTYHFVVLDRSHQLDIWAAVTGGCTAALEWLLSHPLSCRLDSTFDLPFCTAVRSGNLALVRTLLESEPLAAAIQGNMGWTLRVRPALCAAREVRNFDMIQLLFPYSLQHQQVYFLSVRDAVRANDPFTRRYLFGCFEPCQIDIGRSSVVWLADGLPLLLEACMTGNLELLEDVWTFTRCAFRSAPKLFETLGPRIDRALKLCTEHDVSPVMMVLMHILKDTRPRCVPDGLEGDLMALAVRCGNVAVVRLWVTTCVSVQSYLPLAVKHGCQEVIACLIAHGANPLELSLPEQQRLQLLMQS